MVTTYTVTVPENKAGARLDRILAKALPDVSRTRLQSLIRGGQVVAAVDGGRVVDPAHRVEAGSAWTVVVPPLPSPVAEPEEIQLHVVHEDDDLIVVDKPAGLVVHPGAGNPGGTLVNALLRHCAGGLARAGGPVRPGIVHRLDKDTSGLIVSAKSERAFASLVQQFSAHTIERAYYAIVRGVLRQPSGRIDRPVGRSSANRKKMAIVANGKPAATDYRVIRAFGQIASLIECRPLTGRTHQIRVHMASVGHPLIGDPLYGRNGAGRIGGLSRQALHAYLIGFHHPVTGKLIRLESQMPHDLSELLTSLEKL